MVRKMQQLAVRLEKVTKKIGKKTIISDISLQIKPGEVFRLLGPNGAGKTTTIRMTVGLISITAGDILINGKLETRIHDLVRTYSLGMRQEIKRLSVLLIKNERTNPLIEGWNPSLLSDL